MKKLTQVICIVLFSVSFSFAQLTDRNDRQNTQTQPTTQSIASQLPSGKIVQDGPVDSKEYIVGPGDIFYVSIWSATPLNFQVPVTPEGTVVIPTVNEVRIAGKVLEDARKIVLNEIKKKYISGNASFTLFTPRQFTVVIRGAVLNEGSLVVQSTQRVSAALELANDTKIYREQNTTGRAQESGNKIDEILFKSSKRHIQILRKNGTIVKADIQKYIATLNPVYNPLLQDGDVVIVPQADLEKDFIGVFGAVTQRGLYEFVEGDSVTTAVKIAGGITAMGDSAEVTIVRTHSNGNQSELTLNLPDVLSGKDSDLLIQRGDKIIVGQKNTQIRSGIVTIEGEISSPGSYPIIQDSTTLTEVIERAGGFTKYASLNGARIVREYFIPSEKIVTHLNFRKGYTTAEDTAYLRNEVDLKSSNELTSVDFVSLFEKNDSSKNIFLRDGDKIIIPTKTNTVYVFGEVKNPGYVQFVFGKSYSQYIDAAGGLTDNAETGDIRIIKAGTKQWLSTSDTEIEEGDYVWVPKEPYRPFTYYLTVYSQVFGIVGTIATLFLLIRNR